MREKGEKKRATKGSLAVISLVFVKALVKYMV